MSPKPQPTGAIEVFYSYAHEDEKLRDELNKHLSNLKRQKFITAWYDRDISAGKEWKGKIDEHLNSAHIILLLVSSDFLASDYCYDVELTRAMERQEAGEARVIPIILRACDWTSAPFGKLQALPKDAKPVKQWEDQDEAFLDVAQGIRNAVEEIRSQNPTETSASTEAEVTKPAPSLNIPRPPFIGFVARRDEQGRDLVELLKQELASPEKPHITLSGPGGVGKTTLAAEVARELEAEFAGRIVWSRAEGRADFTLSTLLDDIVTQLGHPTLRTLAPDAKAAQVYELISNPPALVVLDNYETISKEAQKFIEAWLADAQCSALITSRPRINTTRNIKVAAMSREEAEEFLEKVIGQTQDSQIFTETIRQRIYETAEANPFVMQWIVGQIDYGAQEPDTVLEELRHGKGDAAQRVFDRSYNLAQLGDDGRAALLALSLFAPSASRAALAAVAGFDNSARINEAIKNLRALWLIKGTDENRRFTIEGLTRSLARARLSKDERATEFRQRFVEHFLNYAKAHAQPKPEDFDALEAEKDNLLAAMDVAFQRQDWESAMAIRDASQDFLDLRGYWDEALQYGELAAQAALQAGDEWGIARFTHNLAIIHQRRGKLEQARTFYDESLKIKKKVGDQRGIAGTRHQLGRLAQDQGKIEEAKRLYNESLEINKKLDNQDDLAITLHQLAIIAQVQGEIAEARRLYNESLAISKKLDNQNGIAMTLYELGRLARGQGEIEEARRLYDESLDIRKKLGDPRGIAISLNALANLIRSQGELNEARRLYEESLAITEKLGEQGNLALIFYNLGLLEEEEGNQARAARLWREALSIFERLGSPMAEKVRRALERLDGEAGD